MQFILARIRKELDRCPTLCHAHAHALTGTNDEHIEMLVCWTAMKGSDQVRHGARTQGVTVNTSGG